MEKYKAAEHLDVAENASEDEIKTAFRQKCKIHHPDIGGSREIFELIRLAHDVLLGKEEPKLEQSVALQEFMNAFNAILGKTRNPFTTDLIEKTKQHLAQMKLDLSSRIGQINLDIENSRGILSRIECKRDNDIIGISLKRHIDLAEQALKQTEVQIETIAAALAIADDYTYKVDEPINNFSTGTWGSYTTIFR